MIKRTVDQVADMLGVARAERPPSDTIAICGVSTDSRTVKPGQLFVPLVGPNFDGHHFVEDSLKKGAAAALWMRSAGPPPAGLPLLIVDDTLTALQRLAETYRKQVGARVIAITGSNGKTTTKDMTASILSTTYRVTKTRGNLNNLIGLPLTLLEMDEHTEIAVLEMGMSARGEIAAMSKLANPEAAVITNIGEAHLLQLGTRAEIARAKLEILHGMSVDGLFLFPGDEPLLADMMKPDRFARETGFDLPEGLRTIRFGMTDSNDYYPIAVMQDGARTRFHLNEPDHLPFSLPVPGHFNVMNAIAAVTVGLYMGVPLDQVTRGLEHVRLSGMRTEWIDAPGGYTIVNDTYNSSPTALRAALEWIGEVRGYKRKMLIVADMLELGDAEVSYHQEIGRSIDPGKFDFVLTYGPLSEHLAAAAREHFPKGTVQAFSSKQTLADWARQQLDTGDLVLVKGSRGMKMEEVVARLQEQ